MKPEKQQLQERRATLLVALENTPGGADRVELQARLSKVNARIREINTIEAAAAKRLADERRADGLAENAANQQRALASATKQASKLIGSQGGKARAAKLSPERRTEIARTAATARWPNGAAPASPPKPSYGEMLLHRAKQTRALIAARAKAAAGWPHVAAFVPHLDAFIEAQEAHLEDEALRVAADAVLAAEQEPTSQPDGVDAWEETWKEP